MPWPVVTHNEDGTASFVVNGAVIRLGELASLEADKTAMSLRLMLEVEWEVTAVPQNASKIAALRTLLGQLRGLL